MGYESQGATFDEKRIYRYSLHRMWGGGSLSEWRTVLWIMLNPSTADERVLDPTLRRCQGFTVGWGYDGFEVVNLFALMATNPQELATHALPIGERSAVNDAAILDAAYRANLIVCGWGSNWMAAARGAAVKKLLHNYKLWHLGQNNDGSPKHPLYLPKNSTLMPFA